jgi:uncharacterized protein
MASRERIDAFLDGQPHAVVGASTNRDKYGNKVLRVYQQHDRPVFPINPRAETIEGLPAYPDLRSLPEKPHGLSIITPPKITEKVVSEALDLGIHHFWMQPGAESAAAVDQITAAGGNVIPGDACLLVVLGFKGG